MLPLFKTELCWQKLRAFFLLKLWLFRGMCGFNEKESDWPGAIVYITCKNVSFPASLAHTFVSIANSSSN